jgi:Glycogen recognition site of AMP-activated protein kinase
LGRRTVKNEIKDDLHEDMQEEALRRIAGMVASLPDREPPGELIDSVMARIKPKKSGRLRIFWRLLQAPVAFAPLRMASIAASFALVFLAVLLLVDRAPEQSPVAPLQQMMNGNEKTVVFTLNIPDASRVELIGSFNQWKPGDLVMTWDKSRKTWVVSLDLRRGRYEYAFLVDGDKVVPDPNALIYRDDGFGNRNSILIVERNNGHEAGI